MNDASAREALLKTQRVTTALQSVLCTIRDAGRHVDTVGYWADVALILLSDLETVAEVTLADLTVKDFERVRLSRFGVQS